jgi:hypothetical protein
MADQQFDSFGTIGPSGNIGEPVAGQMQGAPPSEAPNPSAAWGQPGADELDGPIPIEEVQTIQKLLRMLNCLMGLGYIFASKWWWG